MKYKILVVEDDLDISQLIAKFLIAKDYEVVTCADGANVVELVESFTPDLIIMDIMLPNVDGITCCQKIRLFSDVPIIMLTAKVEESDRLKGLEIGADDYVCKPFSAPELVMRVAAIIKRTGRIEYSPTLLVDELKMTVKYGDRPIAMTHYEFSVFNLLFKSPGRVYSREQIINGAFAETREVYDRAIDSHIKNIRKRFREAGIEQTVIESVYAAGYRFIE